MLHLKPVHFSQLAMTCYPIIGTFCHQMTMNLMSALVVCKGCQHAAGSLDSSQRGGAQSQ